jgi:signal transduction histidine kinase
MQWQVVRIILIFRLLHGAQFAITVPGIAPEVQNQKLALLVFVILLAESGWFVQRVIRLRGYGGWRTGYAELCTGVVLLLLAAAALPRGDRTDLAAPLLILTTEYVTGAAICAAVTERTLPLVAGAAAMAGGYAVLIGTGQPANLGRAGVLIGLSGYPALGYLIWRGTLYLLALASDLTHLSERLTEQRHRTLLGIELHNHLGNTLLDFQRLDSADRGEVERVRDGVVLAGQRLRTFINTGRFDARVSFVGLLERQVALAARDRLTIAQVLPANITEHPPQLPEAHLDVLDAALRAVIINVARHSGVSHAFLRAARHLATDGTGRIEVLVADEGCGLPEEVLRGGVAAMRCLGPHHTALRAIGGDLAVGSSADGTQVTINLPLAADDFTADSPAHSEPAGGCWPAQPIGGPHVR